MAKSNGYTQESCETAAVLGNLVVAYYESKVGHYFESGISSELNESEVYEVTMKLCSAMGLGKATMGQIGEIVASIIRFYSHEYAAASEDKRWAAQEEARKAYYALKEAKEKLEKAQLLHEEALKNERLVARSVATLAFTPASFLDKA